MLPKHCKCYICGSNFPSYKTFADDFERVCSAKCGFIANDKRKYSLLLKW